jgi:SET domain-containing protein
MKKSRKTSVTHPHHHAHMRHAVRAAGQDAADRPLFKVRRSGIHGRGVYAALPIAKGTRIVEYLGERISHKQADDRYAAKGQDDGHTFLFVVNSRVVIDAGVNGNDARFINHCCAPNCDTVIEGGRVFIEALRDIEPGEELGYEYGLTWESTDDEEELENYACRCGAKECRGTMLAEEPLDKPKKRARRKAKAKPGRRSKAKGKTKTKAKGKGKGKGKGTSRGR